MAKKIVTLFIRDTSLNLLVMKGKRVEKWASSPLEPGLVSQGLIVDEAQVADRVKELFKLERVGRRKVIAGLSGLDSLYRVITLPKLPEAMLPEAIKREASRAIPVPLDEVYLSYQLIPASGEETRVFLTTFPRNIADALLRTLRQAGIEPHIMDLAPLALCRIPDEPRAIVVNARLEHLAIMVVADRLPQVIRRLSLFGESESLSEKLPVISEEFSRTVAFYNSSHLEKPLDSTVPVFVCGKMADSPESWQSLAGDSGYSVSPLPPPVEYPDGFPANKFMVNIGLALKELLPEEEEANFSIVNFNALPEVYLPKAISLSRILAPVGIVAGIGLLICMGFLIQSGSAHTAVLRSQLASTESRVVQQRAGIAALQGQVEQVGAQIELVGAQIEPVEATAGVFSSTLTELEQRREEIDADLSQIVSLVPAGVDLTRVTHGGDSVKVGGTVPYENDIFGYARDLRSGGRFSVVIISSIKVNVSEERLKGRQFDFEFCLIK